ARRCVPPAPASGDRPRSCGTGGGAEASRMSCSPSALPAQSERVRSPQQLNGCQLGALCQRLLDILQRLQAILRAEVLGGGDTDQACFELIQPAGGQGIDDIVSALLVRETGARKLPV